MSTTPAQATATKIAFESGGEFLRETRAEVELYLADKRNRRRGALRLYAKAPIAIGLTAVSWVLLLVTGHEVAFGLLGLTGLVAGALLTAFCVQHDANHGAYFGRRRYNHLLGWSADALLGISSYAWRVKHNVAHHTYTNVDGFDDDVSQTPMARLSPTQEPRRWYRFQQYYIWPLYAFMGLRWQFVGDIAAFMRGRVGRSTLRFPKGWNLAALLSGKVIFLTWALVVPLFFYPWWVVLLAYLVFTMFVSLVMAVTFQLAHCVEEADFASADDLNAKKRVWAVHEVETTVNFCPRNRFLTWALGGLNFQIEHHLFPNVKHTHYPQIAAIVRRNCLKHGIRYNDHPSLARALRSHFLHLRTMGRLGQPVHIEMG